MAKNNNHKAVSYNKWGYIFLIPFVVVYLIFQLVPLISTIYNSFFENYRSGLTQIGPNFVGLANYAKLFQGGDIWIYFKNTMIMWVMGFIPQILVSLLLAAWFSNPSLRLKGQRFFKTVIYLPNLIMASAFAMLFFTLFADGGPINADAVRNTETGIFLFQPCLECQNPCCSPELPDVVRKYNYSSYGRYDGN